MDRQHRATRGRCRPRTHRGRPRGGRPRAADQALGQRRRQRRGDQPRAIRGDQRQRRAGRRRGSPLVGPAIARDQPVADRRHDGGEASDRRACRGQGARGLPRVCPCDAAGAGLGIRRQAHGPGGPACRARRAADGDHPARSGLGRREFQGSAAAPDAHRAAGDADRRRLRHRHRIPRDRRGAGRRDRKRICAAARAERHRQLDQGRAAHPGAHRHRAVRARAASVARRPVDGGVGRRRRHQGRDARRRAARRRALYHRRVHARRRGCRRAGEKDHRRQHGRRVAIERQRAGPWRAACRRRHAARRGALEGGDAAPL